MVIPKGDTMTFQYLEEKATIRRSPTISNGFSYLIGFIGGRGYSFDRPSDDVFIFKSQDSYNRVIQEARNLGYDFSWCLFKKSQKVFKWTLFEAFLLNFKIYIVFF